MDQDSKLTKFLDIHEYMSEKEDEASLDQEEVAQVKVEVPAQVVVVTFGLCTKTTRNNQFFAAYILFQNFEGQETF